jgi:hypothetical protein
MASISPYSTVFFSGGVTLAGRMEPIDHALAYNPDEYDAELEDSAEIVRNYKALVSAYREVCRQFEQEKYQRSLVKKELDQAYWDKDSLRVALKDIVDTGQHAIYNARRQSC